MKWVHLRFSRRSIYGGPAEMATILQPQLTAQIQKLKYTAKSLKQKSNVAYTKLQISPLLAKKKKTCLLAINWLSGKLQTVQPTLIEKQFSVK